MNCTEFLDRFSEYLDGSVSREDAEAVEAHLSGCRACGRYRVVVQRGATVLRTLPQPELKEDFVPRLRHRIYDLDAERALQMTQSGTPALTVLGIAVLLAALAWAPVLQWGVNEVRLDTIVVDRPPSEEPDLFPLLITPVGQASTTTPADLDDGLWDGTYLYDYSALSQRYQQRGRVRRVSDYGR